jgi:hypothetical protein
MKNITTIDLSEFGYREIEKAKNLLDAYLNQDIPNEFYENKIKIMFNKRSGFVFLTNSEYQVLMLNDGKLEMFYSLPYEGEEGFAEELKEQYLEDPEYFHEEDIKYMKDYNIID